MVQAAVLDDTIGCQRIVERIDLEPGRLKFEGPTMARYELLRAIHEHRAVNAVHPSQRFEIYRVKHGGVNSTAKCNGSSKADFDVPAKF